jgi:E3 ubiquitin-protein ligase HUWE1
LKGPVFESLQSTLGRIEDLGSAYVPPADIQHWYQLVPSPVVIASDEDVVMQDEPAEAMSSQQASPTAPSLEQADEDNEDEANKGHDNIVVSYIDVIGRVSVH